MKKISIIIAVIIAILCINKTEEIIIPTESIRFRIIANSNSINDQNIKKEIIKSLQNELENYISENDTIETARTKIVKEIPNIQQEINKKLENSNYNKKISIKYGENYFPKKVYKGITYQEGEYESLVITIGEGMGNNFWCVLFPPLCKIDETAENIEYTSLVQEILNKYN